MTGSFVLRGGRVIDPANGVDRIADLVIGRDKIKPIINSHFNKVIG